MRRLTSMLQKKKLSHGIQPARIRLSARFTSRKAGLERRCAACCWKNLMQKSNQLRADPGGVAENFADDRKCRVVYPLSRYYLLSQGIKLAIDTANVYHPTERIFDLVQPPSKLILGDTGTVFPSRCRIKAVFEKDFEPQCTIKLLCTTIH